jgi:hypothetical protein
MIGHLFHREEEHLQYRSFHFREPYQDCFILQPGEELRPAVEQPKSRASITPHLGPKKKISLSAYKSKQANGVITPGSMKVSPLVPPTKAIPAETNGLKDTKEASAPPAKHERTKSPKR